VKRTIHFVSLGCPKNRVDSEVMLGVAQSEGYRHVDDPAAASVIVVNTCGFIDAAKTESIDTILEMADYKASGSCRRLVVAGCLSQRHPDELAADLPEVDNFLGSSDMLALAPVLRGESERVAVGNPADWLIRAASPRALSSRAGSAYVKIAEGCNRTCSFCVIPQLRGKQRSRSIDDVVRETEELVARGVKEINLVSQDTIAYGRDLAASDRPDLAALVERVADVRGVEWLRLFYLYPEKLTPALVELLAHHPRVLPYVDMPLQHAADAMLKRMKRGHGGKRLYQLIEQLRSSVPNLTFRTAFIVGHPGETDAEFDELCELVAWAEFERVGVFLYSDEESSHSFRLAHKVPKRVARARYRKLMAMSRRIARQKNARIVGRTLDVLIEGESDEHEAVLMGRHGGQAPEIDGQVYLTGTEQLARLPRSGEILPVRITQASDYDVAGEVQSLEASRTHGAARPSPRRGRVTLRVLPTDNRVVGS
jgi:ribosomal protein S12 methylthiotransferase